MKRWLMAAALAGSAAVASAQMTPVPPPLNDPVALPTGPTFSTATTPAALFDSPGFTVPQTNSMGPPAASPPPYSFNIQASTAPIVPPPPLTPPLP